MDTVYTYRLTSIIKFGKHQGKGLTLAQLIKEDLSWVIYQYKNNAKFQMDGDATVEFMEEVNRKRRLNEFKDVGRGKRNRLY